MPVPMSTVDAILKECLDQYQYIDIFANIDVNAVYINMNSTT